jgi:inosine/xanthosine triphosphatase
MRVAVGGTFNVLHKGHRVLLEAAFSEGDEVVVGISSDDFAGVRKGEVIPFEDRRERLEEYLEKYENWEIVVLDDAVGTSTTEEKLDILVVTPDNYSTGERINRSRIENGLEPLRLKMVGYVLAEDFLPISSSRILSGEIDEEGRMKRPLKVVVGSANQVKVEAVKSVMDRILDDYELISIAPGSNVSEQPFHEETERGTRERALAALEEGDLGVGIEAGVFEYEDGLYDVQYCVVCDHGNWSTTGHGSGFRYPPHVSKLVRSGKTVSEAFHSLYGKEDIGKKEGAIGYLTWNVLTRKELTEQAVMAAMVPRMRKELYREI